MSDRARVDAARARFDRDPFAAWLGLAVSSIELDRAVVTLPYREEHMNAGGVLNGGASASLLTIAGTLAAWTGMDVDGATERGCADLSLQYLSGATAGEGVVAEARVIRRARGLAFVGATLTAPDDRPICQGLVIYRASDYGGRAPRLRAEPELLAPPSPPTPHGARRADDGQHPVDAHPTPPPATRLFRGYVSKLGIGAAHQQPGRARLSMPCTPSHLDDGGRLHAGAIASIVDIAAVAASWSLVPRREGARGSTIGMQVSYPGDAATAVVADAHVQQRSEELLFSTVHVTDRDSGRLVAMGHVTYRLLEPWPGEATSAS